MPRSYNSPEGDTNAATSRDDTDESTTENHQNNQESINLSRRGAIGALAGGVGLWSLLGRASGQAGEPGAACTWRGDQNAAGYNLYGLGGLQFGDGPVVSSFGDGLAVNGNNDLTVTGSGVWNDDDGDNLLEPSGSATGIDVPTVSTDEVSNGRSFRLGEVVYYNPADSGPYTDGQDALSNVPDGGTFVLAAGTDYDVATEGRLAATRALTIVGEGWAVDEAGTLSGSKIVNTGGDAVDSPVIEIESSNKTGSNWIHNPSIRGLSIDHDGATSPAVRFNWAIRSLIDECRIDMNGTGDTGVEYAGESFFGRMTRSHVTGATNRGIYVTGSGYGHEFIGVQSNHTASGAVALRTERPSTYIFGGAYGANSTDGTGIQFYNTGAGGLRGGYVNSTAESTDTFVDIDGSSTFNKVVVDSSRANLSNVNTFVRFANADGCINMWPNTVAAGGGGDVAEWTASSAQCGVIANRSQLGSAGVTVDGSAYEAWMHVAGHVHDGTMGNLPSASNLTISVDYNIDQNAPVWHDGTGWYKGSATSFTP